MKNNAYWGEVDEDWAGFSAENTVEIPYFEKDVTIFLDDEYDEDWEEKVDPPTDQQLDNYAQTFESFFNKKEKVIVEIKEKSYERYKKIYAKYYEEEENPPLILNDAEAHFQYMKNVLYIRISDDDVIRILIHYDLDEEHGLEIKIQHNKVVAIDGIAET